MIAILPNLDLSRCVPTTTADTPRRPSVSARPPCPRVASVAPSTIESPPSGLGSAVAAALAPPYIGQCSDSTCAVGAPSAPLAVALGGPEALPALPHARPGCAGVARPGRQGPGSRGGCGVLGGCCGRLDPAAVGVSSGTSDAGGWEGSMAGYPCLLASSGAWSRGSFFSGWCSTCGRCKGGCREPRGA